MTLTKIIQQLQKRLPQFTAQFSDIDLAISSITFSAGTVTVTTGSAHGLVVDDIVTISDVDIPNPITSLISVPGIIATATTSNRHDLTESYTENLVDGLVRIEGAVQPEYNGSFELLDVPRRTEFTYQFSGSATSPATGSPQLLERFDDIFYNGLHVISAVPTTTTFEYIITTSPLADGQGGTVRAKHRIAGAVTGERANEAYTRQPIENYWAFVVLNNVDASKSRDINSDASQTITTGTTSPRQRLIVNFEILVFIPSAPNDISGLKSRNQAEEIRLDLIKSLVGACISLGLNEFVSNITYNGDGPFSYNTAYYIHSYAFEFVTDVTAPDIIPTARNVAFREIDFTLFDKNLTEMMNGEVDLDTDPL